MFSPDFRCAIIDAIRGAKFHVGTMPVITPAGSKRHAVNAVDSVTGESFTVIADDESTALTELAHAVGFQLMD